MAEQQPPDIKLPDPVEISKSMASIAERSQKLVADFLERQQQQQGKGPANMDPLNIGAAFMEMTHRMMADPAKLVQAQMTLWQDYMRLWQTTAQRMMGQESEPIASPEQGDRRFKHPEWDENELFDFVKQSYLLTARWMQSTVKEVEGLDDNTAQKVDFYTRQFVDAMAPSNFLMTNPEVLRETLESGGENLVKGLQASAVLLDLRRAARPRAVSLPRRLTIGRTRRALACRQFLESFDLPPSSPHRKTCRSCRNPTGMPSRRAARCT
jgi:polyhydroxyalkanoate synthase